MSSVRSLLRVLVLLFCVNTYADQCAYISKDKADFAKKLVQIGDSIKLYCEPCGEESKNDLVKTLKASPWGLKIFMGSTSMEQMLI